MTCLNNNLIDLAQGIIVQQTYIVNDRLTVKITSARNPVVNAKHLTQKAVGVGKVMKTVVIRIQAQTSARKYEDTPQVHTRTTGRLSRTNDGFQ